MPTARYRDKDGKHLPGVTTIIGDIIAKPQLIHWAWKLGKQGKDYRQVRDKAGDIGTIAHELIWGDLTGEKPKLGDYSENNIKTARIAFDGFLKFKKDITLKTILMEKHFTCETLKFGGTPDWYGVINSRHVLLDFKTGKGLYPEFRLQIAAYKYLLTSHGYPVDECQLLQVNKENGEFHHYRLENLDIAWSMFELLLKIYPLKKKLWKM